MTGRSADGFRSLPRAVQKQIDDLCDRFEAAWQAGVTPGIEDWLDGMAAPEREVLFCELLAAEREYRGSRGHSLNQQEYQDRFPEYAHLIPGILAGESSPVGDDSGTPGSFSQTPRGAGRTDTRNEAASAGQVSRVLGNYELLEEIGRGGMGIIYRARQRTAQGRLVAVKAIRADRLGDLDPHDRREWIERFQREAKAAVLLGEHPHIVPIYEVGEQGGQHFFSMRLIEGGSLAQAISAGAWPSGAQEVMRGAARLVATLSRAVHYAHLRGILHRDLKPSNVLLGSEGQPYVTDFGLAKHVEGNTRLTQSGGIVGTPSYMAPEQVSGPGAVTTATDTYALGAILYELLTGRPPFKAETPFATVREVEKKTPPAPHTLNPAVDRDLETICLLCLRKEPQRRYPSAEALAEDLERWLAGEPITARPVSTAERVGLWCRRNPLVAGVSAASLILFLAAFATVTHFWLVAERKTREVDDERAKAVEQARLAKEAQQEAEQQRNDSYTVQQRAGLRRAIQGLREHRYQEAREALGLVPASRRGWEWHHLRYEVTLASPVQSLIGLHNVPITATLLSKDGRTLISSGQDGRVLQWAAQGDTGTAKPRELEKGIWSSLVREHRHVFLRRWPDPADAPLPDCFVRLAWLEDEQALAGVSLKGKAVVWDLRSGRREEVLAHPSPLLAVAASADGRHLLIGDERGLLLCLDRKSGRWKRLQLPEKAVTDALYVSEKFWLVAQEDGSLHLVEHSLQRVLGKGPTRTGPIWDLDLSPDGSWIAVGGAEGSVETFAVLSERPALRARRSHALPSHETQASLAVHAVRIAPDGKRLAAGDDQGRIVLWDGEDGRAQWVGRDQQAASIDGKSLLALPPVLRRRVTSIEFSPNSTSLFTAGSDTLIKRRDFGHGEGVTTFRVGDQPQVGFDPEKRACLWVAAADGSLSLWESRSGRQLTEYPAHEGPVTGLDVAAKAQLIATCSRDRRVRLWWRSGEKIVPVREPLEHDCPLRSVALSPDGQRVAAYDERDRVTLWNVASGRQIAQVPILGPMPGPALSGLVRFNADGTRLAVAGPMQSFWILSGDKLEEIAKPTLVSGSGGTAIAWHPRRPELVVAGDTLGRIAPYPQPETREQSIRDEGYAGTKPVSGLTFSGDGARLGACSTDGAVWLFDPHWLGLVLTLHSPFANPTSLHFDPTGRRLAAVHAGGEVAVWETPSQRVVAIHQSARPWRDDVLLQGERAQELELRPQGICLDEQGRVHALYCRPAPGSRPGATYRKVVLWGREESGQFPEEVLHDMESENPREVGALHRSLFLTTLEQEVFALTRRPKMLEHGLGFDLLLWRRSKAGLATAETLTSPANHGFDTHFFPRPRQKDCALHFAHDGHYLTATLANGKEWRSIYVGERGDGLQHHAVAGPDGTVHVVFRPYRFGGDRHPLTYLQLAGPDLKQEAREIIDPSCQLGACRLALSPDGLPIVAYERVRPDGDRDLVVARRSAAGWVRSPAPIPLPDLCSNIVCDRHGVLRYACEQGTAPEILLVSGSGDDWRVERIWSAPESEATTRKEETGFTLATLLDRRGQPVVVMACHAKQGGWLRVLRPVE